MSNGPVRKILFIHSSLAMGGIETFFTRLVPELALKGVKVDFLILYPGGDSGILDRLRSHAKVYYWSDISLLNLPFGMRANLLSPINSKQIKLHFSDVDIVHVGNAAQYFLAKRILSTLKKKFKLIFGIYHSNELAWSNDGKLPRYERRFRGEIFNSAVSFYFPNSFSRNITFDANNIKSKIFNWMFPLGIDLPVNALIEYSNSGGQNLKICSVGRLVSFKRYNSYMIDVVSSLRERGVNATYDVYGDGPDYEYLVNKAKMAGVSDFVNFKGTLEYPAFNETVSAYDLFVGSGTAILQAASLGVPCIVGIENEALPVTYGFFSQIPGLDYHEQDLPFPRVAVNELMESFIQMPLKERVELRLRHVEKSKIFSIKQCAENFYEMANGTVESPATKFGFYKFIFLFLMDELLCNLRRNASNSAKYNKILKPK